MSDEVIYPVGYVNPIPAKVYRRQAIKALIIRGLHDQVLAILASLDDGTPEGAMKSKLANVEFNQSLEFYRTWPLLNEVCDLLGLDEAAKDELFVFAATL